MATPQRSKPVYVPPGGPGGVERPSPEIYAALGEDGVFELLADFYRRLGDSEIRHMFPSDLLAASERSAAFFVQLLGGPPLFNERHGPPRMRARHLPFEIDAAARGTWLAAFRATLDDSVERGVFPAEHLPSFLAFLEGFSSWMVNVAPDGTS